jgi:hypothetical protein
VLTYRERTRERSRSDVFEAMDLADRRSLAYGLLIAAKLVVSSESVLDHARRNLRRQRTIHVDGSADRHLDAWAKLPAGPVESILHALASLDEESVTLRHTAPFASVLTDAERHSVIRSTRQSAA